MTTVELHELQAALEWVSSDYYGNEAFICRRKGKIFWTTEEPGILDDGDGTPDDLDDVDKYVPIPHRRDLDLGTKLALNFARLHLPDQYDDVRYLFQGKGAFRRFKDLLGQSGLLDEWYAYSEEATLEALQQWCESEGLVIQR